MSVRQRAVALLYAMCDRSNAQQIVAEMLSYLETADYSIREEIVSLTSCHRPQTLVPLSSSVSLVWLWFCSTDLLRSWVKVPFTLAF